MMSNEKVSDVSIEHKGVWIASHPVETAKEWKCTACQNIVLLPEWTNQCYYKYCPNCGAKMNEGNKNE